MINLKQKINLILSFQRPKPIKNSGLRLQTTDLWISLILLNRFAPRCLNSFEILWARVCVFELYEFWVLGGFVFYEAGRSSGSNWWKTFLYFLKFLWFGQLRRSNILWLRSFIQHLIGTHRKHNGRLIIRLSQFDTSFIPTLKILSMISFSDARITILVF